MSEEKLSNAIQKIEDYYFGEGPESGEQLFITFAKNNKQKFLEFKLNNSTENNFAFTELHNKFQIIYENKLEQLILASDLTVDEFYDLLKQVS
jgi:hypothetical protein